MKRFIAFFLAILLFHSACTSPVEVEKPDTRGLISSIFDFVWGGISAITDVALSVFSGFLKTIGTLGHATAVAIDTLANNTIQALSQTTQDAINTFKNVIAIPATIASKITDALNNSNAKNGLSAITNYLNSLVNGIVAALNTTATVAPGAVAAIQADLQNLQALTQAIIANATAAANAATSGLNMIFPKPLVKVLGDPTLRAIQAALNLGVQLMNNATTTFVNAIQNNPFATFINDVIIAPTQTAIASALTGIQSAVSQIVGDALKLVQGTVTKALSGLNQLIPAVISNVTQILSTVNSTVTTALTQAKTLSDAARAQAHQQIQAALGNLTQILGGLQSNLTTAIQSTVNSILSQIPSTAANVTQVAQQIAGQIINSLITSKLAARTSVITALTKLIPIVQNGVTGLLNCTCQAIAAVHKNTMAVIHVYNGTAALLAQNIQACLNQTTDAAVLSCLNTTISAGFPQLVTIAEALLAQIIQAAPTTFAVCALTQKENTTQSLGQLPGSVPQ